MVNNREPAKLEDYESDPSEEEEGDEGSSEEVGSQDSDSEPEPTQVSKKAPSLTAQKKGESLPAAKSQQAESSSEEEGDESGSETESESDGPDAPKSNIGAKKPVPKPADPEPVTPAKSAVKKGSVNGKVAEVKDPKKGKKKESEPEEKKKAEPESETKPTDDSKKSRFQRLWSEDDEIVILEGMIEYSSKKKSDPVSNLSAFHEFIKKNLHVDVSRAQLQDKIRKLKKKYENNKSKEKGGKDRVFSKPHEQKAYQLSKSIWGNDLGKESGGVKGVGSPKANGSAVRKAPVKKATAESEEAKGSKSVVVGNDEGEKKVLGKRVSVGGDFLSVEDRIIASGTEFFETGKGLEGEREWKRLRVEEVELHLKLLELRTAQAKLFLDALKSEEH